MQTSDTFSKGDVAVVPFPYAEVLAEKRRPAAVISGPGLEQHGLLWIVMITSSENRRWAGDIEIPDPALAGLSHPSLIRPAKMACIARERIVRVAGRLDAETSARLHAAVSAILLD